MNNSLRTWNLLFSKQAGSLRPMNTEAVMSACWKEDPMNKVFALFFAAIPTICCAQMPRIPSGAAVFIEPMGGYETYLAAAFVKRHIPLVVVSDKDKAEFVITSTVPLNDLIVDQPAVGANNANMAGTADAAGDTPVLRQRNSTQLGYSAGTVQRVARVESASIAVIDLRGSRIVFAYAAGKIGPDQPQKMADDCARRLRGVIKNAKE